MAVPSLVTGASAHLQCLCDGAVQAWEVACQRTKPPKAERGLDARGVPDLQHPVPGRLQRALRRAQAP